MFFFTAVPKFHSDSRLSSLYQPPKVNPSFAGFAGFAIVFPSSTDNDLISLPPLVSNETV